MPAASLLSAYKILKRNPTENPSNESSARPSSVKAHIAILVSIGYSFYFMMHSLIHLFLNEDLSRVSWWSFKYKNPRKLRSTNAPKANQNPKILREMDRNAQKGNHMSFSVESNVRELTTYGVTTDTSSDKHESMHDDEEATHNCEDGNCTDALPVTFRETQV